MRRLYYVAMTRARRSLALMSMGPRHPVLDGLTDAAFLVRRPRSGTVDVSACRTLYRTLDPSEVDLSFAGRLPDGHAALRALERLAAGDPLGLVARGDRWWLTDAWGTTVCRLARKFVPPQASRYISGSVHAITTRFREDSAEDYQSWLKRDAWPVVLPELVFEPVPARQGRCVGPLQTPG